MKDQSKAVSSSCSSSTTTTSAINSISKSIRHCAFALLLLCIFICSQSNARPSSTSETKSQDIYSVNRLLAINKRSKDSKSTTVTSKSTNLQFKHVPSKEVTVPVTGNVVLQCEAGGSPPPKIHWLKNGERVVQNVDEFSVDDDSGEKDVNRFGVLGLSYTKSRLFLDCVQPEDAARYSCIAENQYTRISSDTVLNVVQQSTEKQLESMNAESSENSISRCSMSKKSYGLPARIHMWTSSRLEMMGSSVQLYCRHSGAPHSSVLWTGPSDENKVIHTNGYKYNILENGDLVINDLVWEDMGSYSCHVRNQHGNDKVSTFLYPTAPDEN